MYKLIDLMTELATMFILICLRVAICFIRSFPWAVPIWLGWNKILVRLTGFSEMRYFQAYWICFILMAFFSAMLAVNVTNNKK